MAAQIRSWDNMRENLPVGGVSGWEGGPKTRKLKVFAGMRNREDGTGGASFRQSLLMGGAGIATQRRFGPRRTTRTL